MIQITLMKVCHYLIVNICSDYIILQCNTMHFGRCILAKPDSSVFRAEAQAKWEMSNMDIEKSGANVLYYVLHGD
jgi:hypothetical protein